MEILNNQPLISIIIATHNREDLLPKAVGSLLTQTYQNFEIIIVDDASQDRTPLLLSQLQASNTKIRSFRSDINIGPGAARNLGISKAKGDFIAIMDDDDLSASQRLELQLTFLEEHPEIDLVFTNHSRMDADGRDICLVNTEDFSSEPTEVFELLYLRDNKIQPATVMTRAKLWKSFSYPEQPWIVEDWYLFMQIAAKGHRMGLVPQHLYRVLRDENRQGLMSDSSMKLLQARRQVQKMISEWLRHENIHEFDHLHKSALSNQIILESRHYIGAKGLTMLLKAFVINPRNPNVFAQIEWYWSRLLNKLRIR